MRYTRIIFSCVLNWKVIDLKELSSMKRPRGWEVDQLLKYLTHKPESSDGYGGLTVTLAQKVKGSLDMNWLRRLEANSITGLRI